MTPPTREDLCLACSGRGTVVRFDGQAMRAARLALGVTQADVARAAGWHQSVVSEMESGARPTTATSAERYWRALRDATAAREVGRA